MSESIGQKVILISGGSRGLGQGIVEGMLNNGHIVATFSRNDSKFIHDCHEKKSNSFYWEEVDSADYEKLKDFTESVINRFGKIDVLINNAGVGFDGIITLMPEKDIFNLISINLEAAIILGRLCLKSMIQQGSGNIINISSVNAIRGHSGVAVYSATKAGLDGLTRGLAKEFGPAGIRVNSVAPGYFESDMAKGLTDGQKNSIIKRTPLKKLGTIKDMVGVIRFLLSDEAQFITGQTIVVDGGLTC